MTRPSDRLFVKFMAANPALMDANIPGEALKRSAASVSDILYRIVVVVIGLVVGIGIMYGLLFLVQKVNPH